MSGITQRMLDEFVLSIKKRNLSDEEEKREIASWMEIFGRDLQSEIDYSSDYDPKNDNDRK